jgi:hypothetical protein
MQHHKHVTSLLTYSNMWWYTYMYATSLHTYAYIWWYTYMQHHKCVMIHIYATSLPTYVCNERPFSRLDNEVCILGPSIKNFFVNSRMKERMHLKSASSQKLLKLKIFRSRQISDEKVWQGRCCGFQRVRLQGFKKAGSIFRNPS